MLVDYIRNQPLGPKPEARLADGVLRVERKGQADNTPDRRHPQGEPARPARARPDEDKRGQDVDRYL